MRSLLSYFGTPLARVRNLADVPNKGTARANLQLGTAAELDIEDFEAAGAVAGLAVQMRVKLAQPLTLYVRTDGSDLNTGLGNTSGEAFQTLQQAVDVASSLDNGGYDITIQVADGTYAGRVSLRSFVGAGRITLQGNASNPAHVVLSHDVSGTVLANSVLGLYVIKDVMITNSAGNGVSIFRSDMEMSGCNFGNCSNRQISVSYQGRLSITGNYTISGSAATHLIVASNAFLLVPASVTCTLSGTPAFAGEFANTSSGGVLQAANFTFSGSATGVRYTVTTNGVITGTGGAAAFFPGTSNGSTATGGQYT